MKKSKSRRDRVLDYFDREYCKIFENKWPSIRLGLLSMPKYAALINNNSYVCSSSIKDDLKQMGCLDFLLDGQYLSESFQDDEIYDIPKNSSRHFQMLKKQLVEHDQLLQNQSTLINEENDMNEFEIKQNLYQNEVNYRHPVNVKAMVMDRSDFSHFEPAKRDHLQLLTYYLMDAASLLPVLALNLNKNDFVLDMCAAPGGKSLAMIQTESVAKLICNDVSTARINRLKYVLNNFCPKSLLEKNVQIMMYDASLPSFKHAYSQFHDALPNKILIDAPCTNDRHSLFTKPENYFSLSSSSVTERNRLLLTQRNLLINGLRMCKNSGLIIYSTCTLCPQQNDGTVEKALEIVKSEAEYVVLDAKDIFESTFKYLMRFCSKINDNKYSRLGVTVLPNIINNYGPSYISVIKKIK